MPNAYRSTLSGGVIDIESIEVTTPPTKTRYIEGEMLDTTGIAVTATAGLLSGNVASQCTYNPTVLDEVGTQDVSVRYLSKTTSFPVIVQSGTVITYGFHIDSSVSNPSNAVTYLNDAVGMTPAHMDFSTGEFDYGDWENAFFMPRPCMLKSDGTVDYYLDPDDYSKKLDGTASDVANTSYDGNAMMEWGKDDQKIWLKIVPDENATSGSVYISNVQSDAEFHDYNFHDCNGNSADHFYTPIYDGSYTGNTLRSLSGQQAATGINANTARTAAKANNSDTNILWDIECFADRQLINFLLVLIGKSLNTQAVFGQGLSDTGDSSVQANFRTGVHNTKGLFYGTTSDTATSSSWENCIKIFGMENYWGFIYKPICGLINDNLHIKYKLTRNTEDGSSTTDYNFTGADYVNPGINFAGTGSSSYYIKYCTFTSYGMFPTTRADSSEGGSATTYYCDQIYSSTSNSPCVYRTIASAYTDKCGAFAYSLEENASYGRWRAGASLSCKPIVAT